MTSTSTSRGVVWHKLPPRSFDRGRIDALQSIAGGRHQGHLCNLQHQSWNAIRKSGECFSGTLRKNIWASAKSSGGPCQIIGHILVTPCCQFYTKCCTFEQRSWQAGKSFATRCSHYKGSTKSRFRRCDESLDSSQRIGRCTVEIIEQERSRTIHEHIFSQTILKFLPRTKRFLTTLRIQRQSIEKKLYPVSFPNSTQRNHCHFCSHTGKLSDKF